MKSVKEEIIDKWKELNIKSCTMEFSCGGDSMNDYSFTLFNNDNEQVECSELTDYFEEEVFRVIQFYECSDGHYLGEFGNVEITLEGECDDEEFEYQNQRLKWGLTPDPLDIGEYKDSVLRGGSVK